MKNSISPFNWSLKKATLSLPDSFSRARLNILYVVLVFALIKAIVVMIIAAQADQQLQLLRAIAGLVLYTVILKLLLAWPQRVKLFAHFLLWMGLFLVWSNIIFYVHEPNIPVLQFTFMVILCSFYMLSSTAALIYSAIAILPILISSFSNILFIPSKTEQLASPGYEILNALNFVTIIIAHYLFQRSFRQNLAEKETLNKELQQSMAATQKLAESRQQFISTMSHELRTPLNSVLGVTELLLEDAANEQQKQHLEILRYSASDLLSLINNILDINKLEANKLQLESTPVKLCELTVNLCTVLQLKAKEKQLNLSVECDDQLKHLTVLSDPTRIAQILYNLVGNAIRFTDKGKVTVSLRLLQLQHNRAEIAFSVADTGIGIAPAMHQKIFEPFAQASKDTTRKYGGTGLGLAIVKQVLTEFDTTIELESDIGKGAVFGFRLNLPVTDNATITETISPDVKTGLNLKILVAEDNEINQMVLQKQLERLQVDAVMVSNGVEAYTAFMEQDFDAVLLDLDMPLQDGYDTIRKIRELQHPVKSKAHIIAFTASVTEHEFITKSGFNDQLYKPVNMQELREKLQRVTVH